MAVAGVKNVEIPRVANLTPERFHREFFTKARPVIITDAAEDWPCREWTIEGLAERVGGNEVMVRGKTNQEDYRVGKSYTIRRDTFGSYCKDLLAGNKRAQGSYLAVASIAQAFPQLQAEVPLPVFLEQYGKLHLGPYLWLALRGHYEFCHFDPDDNFLTMIRGRKQVRLVGHSLAPLYPNPLGSQGKTIQSQINLDSPDLERFPLFKDATVEHCVLSPGEMLFIPAFYWHQVNALDTGISINMFYGDPGEHTFLDKLFHPPFQEHFYHWFLNILEQNRDAESFSKIVSRLPDVIPHFVLKQWHECPTKDQVDTLVALALDHLGISELPEPIMGKGKFPPVLKIRGLLHRNGAKTQKKQL